MLDKKTDASQSGNVSSFLRGLHSLKSSSKSHHSLHASNELPGQPQYAKDSSTSPRNIGTPDKHSSLPPLQMKRSKSDLRNVDPATAALMEGLAKAAAVQEERAASGSAGLMAGMGSAGASAGASPHPPMKKSMSSGSLMNGTIGKTSNRASKVEVEVFISSAASKSGSTTSNKNRRTSSESPDATQQRASDLENLLIAKAPRSHTANPAGLSNASPATGLLKSRISQSMQHGLMPVGVDFSLDEENDKVSELNLATSNMYISGGSAANALSSASNQNGSLNVLSPPTKTH
ncbi:hypothetical protein HK101_004388, partial [Irineochytrium annulatum]